MFRRIPFFLPLTLWRDRRGAAAAEMALVTPLLLMILFGGLEGGHYLYNQHKVVKGVRDGARYAARLPFADYSCAALTDAAALTRVQNVTRTGLVSGGTAPIPDWANEDVTVAVRCDAGTTEGIYKTETSGAPVVTVSTTVAYPSLLRTLGFDSAAITLSASAQSAVMGL